MRRFASAIASAGLIAAPIVFAQPASAACHAFTSQVSPMTVNEGDDVTVIVERDAAAADSNVRVATVNGSANGGSDYTPLNEVVSFTGNQTQVSFEIDIIDDQQSEGDETFIVRLSDPGGCIVNTNYTTSPDRTVTIRASDQQAETPPPTAAPTPPPTPAPTPSPTPTPTGTASPTPSPSPTLTPTATPAEEDDDGGSVWPVIGIALGALAVASGAGILIYRRRMAG